MVGIGLALACNPAPVPGEQASAKSVNTEPTEKKPGSPKQATAAATDARPSVEKAASRYPGELPGYTFYRDGDLEGLVPLQSTYTEIVKALGKPDEASDIGRIGESWSDIKSADQPVLTYNYGKWKMLIYFVKSDYFARERYPKALYDKLFTIDLLPRNALSFAEVRFPKAFKAERVTTEAAFIEMKDGSGLVYQMWAKDGGRWGNLERISYGPSDRP